MKNCLDYLLKMCLNVSYKLMEAILFNSYTNTEIQKMMKLYMLNNKNF
jgi:hypothetical protein